MDPLFPAVDLEQIGSLSLEELDELISQYESAFGAIATGAAFAEMEEPPDYNERKALATEGAETLKALKAARDEKIEEGERFATEMAELAADAGVELAAETDTDDGDDDGDGDGGEEDEPEEAAAETVTAEADTETAESEAVEEAVEEPVVAAAVEPRTFRHKPPAVPRRHQPVIAAEGGRAALRASAGMEGFSVGETLDREGLARATATALRSFVTTPPGFSQKVVIASADWSDTYPEERRLHGESLHADHSKILAVRGPEALVAAGGWCAPSTIRYDIEAMGVTDRPVRDALTAFNATRGGLQYIPDISIAETDLSDGITHMTEEMDEGGTFTKDCVVVDCPDFSDVRADIIAACLQAGNLASIAFPELISAWQDLLGVLAARTRDSLLLDAIKTDAQTTQVTETGQEYGAYDALVYNLLRLAAGYRSRHRLADTAVLRALAPAWLADLIVADLVARQFPLGGPPTRASVAGLIQQATNVAVEFYLDSSSDGGQIIGAQSAGDILDFPDTAEVVLYPEGGILFIDQGELNIGLVRDSVLNETNDVRFFAETFENAAVVAAEVFWTTMTLCPTGEVAPTATARSCA